MNDSSPDLPHAFVAATAPIRRLSIDDLPACLHLAASREWSPEESKWHLLFEIGAVYGIDDPAGGLAGAVVSTEYGREVAAISMMLVAKPYERRGLGGRLMTHAMERAGTATTWLTATAAGRPLYERLGFRAISGLNMYAGALDPRPVCASVSRAATSADLPAILALDAIVFGAPRAPLLTRLMSFAETFRVVDGPGGITAFGAAWPSADLAVLGPIVAENVDVAMALLADLAAFAERPVRLDADHRHPRLLAWAEAHGLRVLGTTAVMVHGAPLPGDRARLFTPAAVALG